MQKVGNENASHTMIPDALGFYMEQLILGMCEINVLTYEIITTLRIRNFVINEIIKFMSNIKLLKKSTDNVKTYCIFRLDSHAI